MKEFKGFKVIDPKTGKKPDLQQIVLNEEWAQRLVYTDIDGFYIDEYGDLILADECGNFVYCPSGRFEVYFIE